MNSLTSHSVFGKHHGKTTVQDYLNLPDNGERYQLIEGNLVSLPSPTPLHQLISSNLEAILREFVKSRRLGQVFHAPPGRGIISTQRISTRHFIYFKGAAFNHYRTKHSGGTRSGHRNPFTRFVLLRLAGQKSRLRTIRGKRILAGRSLKTVGGGVFTA